MNGGGGGGGGNRIVVVCTGNIARSPALAAVLGKRCDDLDVSSAAVGRKAVAGLPMKRRMREILAREGLGVEAEGHRSKLLTELEWTPDLLIAVAPVHMSRLAEILPDVPRILCEPPIPDPAFGGPEAYEIAWHLIQQAADGMLQGL